MPFYDVATENNGLDALWPTDAPTPLFADLTFDFGLLTSDPRVSGAVEEMPADGSAAAVCWGIFAGGLLRDFAPLESPVTFTGYARITVPNDGTFWLPADEGEKSGAPQTFPGLARPIIPTVRF